MKYRLKGTVEAFEYDGDLKGTDGNYYVPDWAVKAFEEGTLYYEGPDLVLMRDNRFPVPVHVGDYVVKDGIVLYAMDKSCFEGKYEPCGIGQEMVEKFKQERPELFDGKSEEQIEDFNKTGASMVNFMQCLFGMSKKEEN